VIGRSKRTLKKRQEKKRLRFVLSLVLLASVSGALLYYLTAHALVITDISFVGNHHIKEDELRGLSGLKVKDNLFRLSPAEIHQRLIKSPWIKDAAIRRDLSGTVEIRIREAVPVALLIIKDDPFLIDKDGIVLERMREDTTLFLPVIRDINPTDNGEAYREVISFLRFLNERKVLVLDGNMEVTGKKPEEITLRIDGIPVRVGSGDFEKKLERLQFVKDEIRKRNIEVASIDLRFANRIIVQPVEHVTEPAKAPRPAKPAVAKETRHDRNKKKKGR
jgi:cell division protein FtsQ